jgi:peptide/nickel transport system substrate-binding protein
MGTPPLNRPDAEREQQDFGRLLDAVLSGRLNRRQVLARAAALGLSAASIATLSAAAGGPLGLARPAAVPSRQDETPKPGGTLKVGLQADPTALDFHLQTLTAIWHVVEHIYNRLVVIQPDLAIGPELAESWEISEDGLVYTFKLRQGVMFHPPVSRPLVANDVKVSFDRWRSDISAAKAGAASIASVEAPDDATVVVTLSSPDTSLLANMAGAGGCIFAPETLEEHGDLSQVAVGTGPFRFIEYVPNTRIVLERNPEYWEEGLPYLDGMEMTPIPEDTSRTTAVVTGTVDFIEYAPLRDIELLEGDDSIVMAGDENTNLRYLTFNMRKQPFDNLLFRQAVAAAIDREAILGPAVFGHGTPTVSFFPESFSAALPVPIPAPDIEGAKSLLADAGVDEGFQTTITSWAQYSFLSNAAVVIQEQLKQIGIEAELNLVENATMVAEVHGVGQTPTFDLGVTGQSAYIDPNQIIINFRTGEQGNSSGYSNPQVDDLINQGIAATDQAQRAEIYQEIQRILIQDLPYVNLFIAKQFEAMKDYVKGYTHIATGTNITLKNTWLDQ